MLRSSQLPNPPTSRQSTMSPASTLQVLDRLLAWIWQSLVGFGGSDRVGHRHGGVSDSPFGVSSQTSPTPSPSVSRWLAFGVSMQCRTGRTLVAVQVVQRLEPPPGLCSGTDRPRR